MNEPRNLRKAYVEKLRECEISLKEKEKHLFFKREVIFHDELRPFGSPHHRQRVN